jgi:Spy/CpxP family protein refolding chaperone
MLKLKSLLYIAVCAVTATLALAQPPERRGPGFEPRPPGPLGRIEERLGELGLSDEQKERLKKLNRDTGREIGDLMRKLREAHREFNEVLKEYNLDRRRGLGIHQKDQRSSKRYPEPHARVAVGTAQNIEARPIRKVPRDYAARFRGGETAGFRPKTASAATINPNPKGFSSLFRTGD